MEEKRIRDFVIAIDTSASTKDGLVRRFIEKTYAILSQETSFFADMNVLIVQCDAAITDVARISNLRDLDDYLDGLEIKGLGGTDFRPVFAYVDAVSYTHLGYGREAQERIAREGDRNMVEALVKAGFIDDASFDRQIELLRACNRTDCVAYLMEHHRAQAKPTSAKERFAL